MIIWTWACCKNGHVAAVDTPEKRRQKRLAATGGKIAAQKEKLRVYKEAKASAELAKRRERERSPRRACEYKQSSAVADRVNECAKRWRVAPASPNWWYGDGFTAGSTKLQCARHAKGTPNKETSRYDPCLNPRMVSFPLCNLTIVIGHKSASSMVLGQFENICKSASFYDMKGRATSNGGFKFDHSQDILGSNTRNLDVADNTELVSPLFTVFVLRDPYERAMGMYNMFANCPSFGRGTFLTENEVSAVEANYSTAFVDQWRWRFSQFLAWLSKHPTLSSDALSHFTQQATHLGVGCDRELTNVDLIGRSEKLPELMTKLAELVPRFRDKYASFTNRFGRVTEWDNTRYHDARGRWSMTPCLLTKDLINQIRKAFPDDFECFNADVIKNTQAPLMFNE